MTERKKKKQRTRTRDWERDPDNAYTHDLRRHRRTTGKIKSEPTERRAIPTDFEPNGRVVSHTKKYATVRWDGREELCRIDEGLTENRVTLLAPGDRVLVEQVEDQWMVRAIAPRQTTLSRPGTEGSRILEQVIAANIDVLVIIVSVAKPRFQPGLIDRYLITAQIGGVAPVLCLNKVDLLDGEPAPDVSAYEELGLTIIHTSCETGEGIDELRSMLTGKLSVFAGQSGVGKSSLLNMLDPDLDLYTQEVSDATEKGKHTTTTARAYDLADDIRVIDTPGIRALGLAKITEHELAFYFPELAQCADRCKFRNCTHSHEPDCAVRDAVETGEIPKQRYRSYLRIRESLEDGGRSADP